MTLNDSVGHAVCNAVCDYNVCTECRFQFRGHRSSLLKERDDRNKDACLNCSKKMKKNQGQSADSVFTFDEDSLLNIDSEAKAYFLGLVASTDALKESGIHLRVVARDWAMLLGLAKYFDLTVRNVGSTCLGLDIKSEKFVDSACAHLKMSSRLEMPAPPDLDDENLVIAYVRGVFDGSGAILSKLSNDRSLVLEIPSSYIGNLINLGDPREDGWIELSGLAALEFLSSIYDGAKHYSCTMRDMYLDWAANIPVLRDSLGREEFFKYCLAHDEAEPPYKKRSSDSGYDLKVIEKVKQVGDVEFWTTGVKLQPSEGWYFDMVPRSSLSKRGYMLANMVGVIDRSYTGPVMVPLRKLDESADEIQKGERLVQIIPRPVAHFVLEEVEDLEETDRGDGGFGSTGK